MAVQIQKRLFTVDQYEQMIQTNVLGEDERLELIEGEIVEMSPISPEHAACVKRLNRILTQMLGKRALVGVQDPIRISARSEPQPDLVLLKPRDDEYAGAHPVPEDIWLVVEVAETSLEYDRNVKMGMYAQAGIVEVWLVSLADRRVEVYREPSPQGYRVMRHIWPGESLATLAFPDESIEIGEIIK